MAPLKTVRFTSGVWWFTTVRLIPFPTHVTSVQGLCISSSLVPRIFVPNIYHPWHPGPLHIIILSFQNPYIFFLKSLASNLQWECQVEVGSDFGLDLYIGIHRLELTIQVEVTSELG